MKRIQQGDKDSLMKDESRWQCQRIS